MRGSKTGLTATLLSSLRRPTDPLKGAFQLEMFRLLGKSPALEISMTCYPAYRDATFSHNYNLRSILPGKTVQLSHLVIDLMKSVSKAKLPTCLAEPFKEKVFEACVEDLFASLSDQEREEVLIQIGNFPGRRPSSIIEDAASTMNCPRVVRALVLGRLLGIRPENLFESFPPTDTTTYWEKTDTSQLPSQLVVGDEVYFSVCTDFQHDFQGGISHAVMELQSKSGRFFHLLAARTPVQNKWGKPVPVLTLGQSCAPNFVLGAVEIDANPASTVFLPLDLHTALTLRQKVKRAEIPSTKAVVSGIVGGAKAIEAAEVKVLAHHRVVLLPNWSREGLLAVFDVVKILRAVNADVKIYPWPLLVDTVFSSIRGEAWEQNLHRNATSLKRVEDVSALLYRLNEDSLTPEQFERFLEDIGMVTVERASVDVIPSEDIPKIKKFSDLSRGHTENYKPDLARIFNVGQISLLWGPSNSGKSLMAASFALAIASGKSMFGIPNHGSKRSVLVVDGELTEQELANRYEQLASAYELADDLDRISFIPTRSYAVDDCNLLNGKLDKTVCNYAQKNQYDVVIFDNLITLAPTSARGNEDALFSVIRSLERLGASVIIVHHATKDGASFKGSSNLASKSQNILKIEGRCDLEAEKEYSPTLRRAFDAKGAICRLKWEKCKTAPGLEGQTRTWQLPVGKAWQDLDVQVETESSSADGAEVTRADVTTVDLTNDEQKVLELFTDGRTRIKRTDVEQALSCHEDKAGSTLKSLVEKGQLESIGAGRGTKYQRVG